ncbi:unnamed protein product [Arabidopsis lyrata]|uniref:Uncharacterized protein n=1 Tax=Arabidopsis lyrata subsp. lyrata TaxID=81972 RepID=D7KKK7_ARALL|nr:F-box/LRR-repeat protein 4 [Arabidopsis lyrata subsp. lyrata]EFH66041.1 hypothetical protein ARALYDRAFT_888255 [Arabidopsis lyrata subsp. lyrata]CAH8251761.1 unnamed protein product [Arabidopsis lyrata]|eukprot:XP_002889782.1 F-box/LRR-repeat protein 4 [Arabidopsis lyrata subsp. lyrata]
MVLRDWRADARTPRFFVDSEESIDEDALAVAETEDGGSFFLDTWGQIRRNRPPVRPKLLDLCLRGVAENSHALSSLQLVPDDLKSRIASMVPRLSKIDANFVKLLVQDSPAEVIVKDCSSLEENDVKDILSACNGDKLQVLILYFCAQAHTDSLLSISSNRFPVLSSLSLRGAFRLTDNALDSISKAAPSLELIDLSECSMLTSFAMVILVNNFGATLRGLDIEGCQIDLSQVSEVVKNFKSLEYFSIAGVEGVDDGFVVKFLEVCGSKLTGLSLARCEDVSDVSIQAIGKYCANLGALDVWGVVKLTDMALKYMSVCSSLCVLKFGSNSFSDQAIATFLEEGPGPSLQQLCLHKIREVAQQTATTLSECCKSLWYLDLSWCQKITGEDVCKILVGCPSLSQVRGFGCKKVLRKALEAAEVIRS